MRILSDNEFLAMVADRGNPEEMNRALLTLRQEGRSSCLTTAVATR